MADNVTDPNNTGLLNCVLGGQMLHTWLSSHVGYLPAFSVWPIGNYQARNPRRCLSGLLNVACWVAHPCQTEKKRTLAIFGKMISPCRRMSGSSHGLDFHILFSSFAMTDTLQFGLLRGRVLSQNLFVGIHKICVCPFVSQILELFDYFRSRIGRPTRVYLRDCLQPFRLRRVERTDFR